MPHEVFISYATEDKSTAEHACDTLESNGVRCWMAPRNIAPGAEWGETILAGIDCAKIMVLILSAHADRSKHVQREVMRAFENGLTVIPFRIADIKPTGNLAYYIPWVQWVDAWRGDLDDQLLKLSRSVRNLISENESGISAGGLMRVSRGTARELYVDLHSSLSAPYGLRFTLHLDFGFTKGLLGPSSNPSDQKGFQNEEGTLFGISHQPCTKASVVYLFILSARSFMVLNDIGEQISRLLPEPFDRSATGFLRIEAIKGKTVELQTVSFEQTPYPRLNFAVTVEGDGGIRRIQ